MNISTKFFCISSILFFLTGCLPSPSVGKIKPAPDNHTYSIPTTITTISLPEPRHESDVSIESALVRRRSVREYPNKALSLFEIGQLLWAAQGITSERGFRTAPSAGALYPLEIYLVAGNVDGLPCAVYKYIPQNHTLVKIVDGDKRRALQSAALNQKAVGDAAAIIVIAAVYERTTGKYGERGNRYVHMEVGSAAQNIYLQTVSLDLATVFIGAFHDDGVKFLLHLEEVEQPLGLMPVGKS